ncbi:hypothetical protein N7513_012382 [Penicillium frequentans]|nr:hypothetical protein N7513_012382 [Penicillium glabrum]
MTEDLALGSTSRDRGSNVYIISTTKSNKTKRLTDLRDIVHEGDCQRDEGGTTGFGEDLSVVLGSGDKLPRQNDINGIQEAYCE